MDPEAHFSLSASSFSKIAVLQTKLQKLKYIVPNAAIFISFPIQKGICDFSIDSVDETFTADECDNNLFPEPLTSLSDYEAVNPEKGLLKEHSLHLFTHIKKHTVSSALIDWLNSVKQKACTFGIFIGQEEL